MTAHDAVTMMACIVHRADASPLTTWLLDLARDVEPSNAFGIPDGLPPGTDLAVKNGWTAREATGRWHVNSLAHWDRNVLAVLTAYPEDLGQGYGARIAAEVAAQLFA